jgi:GTP-binding protein HflX
MRVVDQVLADIGISAQPVLPVFNKMDQVREAGAFIARARELYPEAIFATTLRIDGLDALKQELRRRERLLRPPVTVYLPLADGARLASLYRMGEVLDQTVVRDRHAITLRLPAWQIDQLRREGVEVQLPGSDLRVPSSESA